MKRILFPIILLVLVAASASAQLNTWRWQNPLPVGEYLRAVQMVTPQSAFTCGDQATFMRTRDTGNTWDFATHILNLKENLFALSFLDESFGMCAGDSGKVIKTTDGGKTWQLLDTKLKTK